MTKGSSDCFTPEKRSEVMRAVAHENTAAELRVSRELWRLGLRYRKHYKIEGTRPDICFLGPKIAIFIDGCFWHGCPQHYSAPVSNAESWSSKLERNKARDIRNNKQLENAGWTAMRFWECEVNNELSRVTTEIQAAVRQHTNAHKK